MTKPKTSFNFNSQSELLCPKTFWKQPILWPFSGYLNSSIAGIKRRLQKNVTCWINAPFSAITKWNMNLKIFMGFTSTDWQTTDCKVAKFQNVKWKSGPLPLSWKDDTFSLQVLPFVSSLHRGRVLISSNGILVVCDFAMFFLCIPMVLR